MKTLYAGNLPFNTTEQELNDLDREDDGFKREDRGEFRPRRSFRRDGEEGGNFRARRPFRRENSDFQE